MNTTRLPVMTPAEVRAYLREIELATFGWVPRGRRGDIEWERTAATVRKLRVHLLKASSRLQSLSNELVSVGGGKLARPAKEAVK